MAHLDIANRLAIYGYKGEIDDFDELLADEWWRHYAAKFRTVENMLHSPTEALKYVETIRLRAEVADLLEDEILLRLTNIRKSQFLAASRPD
ncbi:MAG: hypothetical protein U9N61_10885 [Euryarchaeota archaeon]|nr:hypothetical protein [Euryarchaeota archaeon]